MTQKDFGVLTVMDIEDSRPRQDQATSAKLGQLKSHMSIVTLQRGDQVKAWRPITAETQTVRKPSGVTSTAQISGGNTVIQFMSL